MKREKPEVPTAVCSDELLEIQDFNTILSSFDIGEPILTFPFFCEDAETDEALEEFSVCRPLKQRETFGIFPAFIPRCHLYIINNFTIQSNCRMLQ